MTRSCRAIIPSWGRAAPLTSPSCSAYPSGLARYCLVAGCLVVAGCHTAGSDWMSQPLPGTDDPWTRSQTSEPPEPGNLPGAAPREGPSTLGVETAGPPGATSTSLPTLEAGLEGRVLGVFRNTYYDFPSEAEFRGKSVSLMDNACQPIKQVPLEFHDAVCVQGSGNLVTGITVSFARRDCECARVCPRTGQRICFEALDREKFPWGRGALGRPIRPLYSVAVDDSVIAMQSVLYVPEFDGLPLDTKQSAFHDGCLIAEDRGLKVKGQHIDVFTGRRAVTQLWNRLVPSNQGVTVVLESPKCSSSRARRL